MITALESLPTTIAHLRTIATPVVDLLGDMSELLRAKRLGVRSLRLGRKSERYPPRMR